MTTRREILGGAAALAAAFGPAGWIGAAKADTFEVTKTDAEWRKILTPDQFAVLRKSGTERPFTSALLEEHRHALPDGAGGRADRTQHGGAGHGVRRRHRRRAAASHDRVRDGRQAGRLRHEDDPVLPRRQLH